MLGKPRPFRSAWQLYLRTRGDFASAGRRDARRLGARSPVRYKCFWPVGACNEAARLHSKFFRHEQEVPDEGRGDVRRVVTLTGAWPERHSHRTHLRERERKTRCARRPDAELRTSRGRPAVALGSSHDVVSPRRRSRSRATSVHKCGEGFSDSNSGGVSALPGRRPWSHRSSGRCTYRSGRAGCRTPRRGRSFRRRPCTWRRH